MVPTPIPCKKVTVYDGEFNNFYSFPFVDLLGPGEFFWFLHVRGA